VAQGLPDLTSTLVGALGQCGDLRRQHAEHEHALSHPFVLGELPAQLTLQAPLLHSNEVFSQAWSDPQVMSHDPLRHFRIESLHACSPLHTNEQA
jgi:hypothetical protein